MINSMETPVVTIRDMQLADRGKAVRIIRQTMTRGDAVEARITLLFYLLMNAARIHVAGRFYVAQSGDKVVGVVGYYRDLKRFWLGWLAVDPGYQQTGIGSRLLKLVEEELERKGVRRLYVYTSLLSQFARARAFYGNRDFSHRHWANPLIYGRDALIISKDLPGPRGGR